jgi:hypothetical protein
MVCSFGDKEYSSREEMVLDFTQLFEAAGAVITKDLVNMIDSFTDLIFVVQHAKEETAKNISQLTNTVTTLENMHATVKLLRNKVDIATAFIQGVKAASPDAISVEGLSLQADKVLQAMVAGQFTGSKSILQ